LMTMKLLACDVGRLWAEDNRATEYVGIEALGALDVIRNDEVAHHHSLYGLRGFGHRHLHSVGLMPRLRRGLKPSVNYVGSSKVGLVGAGQPWRPAGPSEPPYTVRGWRTVEGGGAAEFLGTPCRRGQHSVVQRSGGCIGGPTDQEIRRVWNPMVARWSRTPATMEM
jgi:hypothetical protein